MEDESLFSIKQHLEYYQVTSTQECKREQVRNLMRYDGYF